MDDRSERLRKRRKQTSAKSNGRSEPDASEPSEPAGTSNSSKQSKPAEPSKPEHGSESSGEDGGEEADGEDGPIPVKEQQTGTYMYLPETQVKRLRRQYNVLKAEYEFEYDEEFEKNRHFYPLVVRYGLERLDELDTSEIRARLEAFYE